MNKELKNIKPLNNYVLIKLGSENNKIELANGVEIYYDTSYEEGLNTTVLGEVVNVPSHLRCGQTDMCSMEWETDMELKVGDIVWFHYMECIKALGDHKRLIEIDGDKYIFVAYDKIFVAKRYVGKCDKKTTTKNLSVNVIIEDGIIYSVIMLNGYVLIQPDIVEEKTVIELPNYTRKKKSVKSGVVKFLGSKNKAYYEMYKKIAGDEGEFKINDGVIFERNCDVPLENKLHLHFNGKEEYYRVQRKFIHGNFN